MTSDGHKSARFSEDDVFLALRAANRAGVNVAVEILPDGTIRLVPVAKSEGLAMEQPLVAAITLREIWKIEDVAKHWNISPRSVRSAIAAGRISHFRIGSLIRIKRVEIERIDQEGGLGRTFGHEDGVPYVPIRVPLAHRGGRPDAHELGKRTRLTKTKPK